MAYQDILYERRSGVGKITINRPDKHNALRIATFEELIDILEDASADRSVGVLVLTGAGEKAFCAGGDLEMASVVSQTTHTMRRHYIDRMIRISTLITQMEKPVISAMNGLSVGGGSEIALFCDLVIAADNASFLFNGTRLGGCSWWGAPQLLPMMVGIRKAQEILFFAKPIDAREAERLGLINKVVPRGELKAETERWCEALLDLSPTGLHTTKASIKATLDMVLGSMSATAEMNVAPTVGPEAREAFDAFLTKRKANWRSFRPPT